MAVDVAIAALPRLGGRRPFGAVDRFAVKCAGGEIVGGDSNFGSSIGSS